MVLRRSDHDNVWRDGDGMPEETIEDFYDEFKGGYLGGISRQWIDLDDTEESLEDYLARVGTDPT